MAQLLSLEQNFRFSGHETFTCRFSWIPKALVALQSNPSLFGNEDEAMVELGVGKNMVRSIKFWVENFGIATSTNSHHEDSDNTIDAPSSPHGNYHVVSDFGNDILGYDGYDPYLEDIKTLWLLHWNLCTQQKQPIFFWYYLLNFWHRPDFTQTEVVNAFSHEIERMGRKQFSQSTYINGFRIFINTYLPLLHSQHSLEEDSLDRPFVDLSLISVSGEKRLNSGLLKSESIYSFNLEEKKEITPDLLVYCIEDYRQKYFPNENTVSFKSLCFGINSPGQVFKLPEKALFERLESIEADSNGVYKFEESSTLQQVSKLRDVSLSSLLTSIYVE